MREGIVEHTSYLWRGDITPIFHLATEHLSRISSYRWHYLCHYISPSIIAFSGWISDIGCYIARDGESISHHLSARRIHIDLFAGLAITIDESIFLSLTIIVDACYITTLYTLLDLSLGSFSRLSSRKSGVDVLSIVFWIDKCW